MSHLQQLHTVDELFHFICGHEEQQFKKLRTNQSSNHVSETQHLQVQIPTLYQDIVTRVEDKFKRRNTQSDLLIDLRNLSVSLPPEIIDSDLTLEEDSDIDSDSDSDFEDTDEGIHPTNMALIDDRRLSSASSAQQYHDPDNAVVPYMKTTPSYDSARISISSLTSLVAHEPPRSSLVFNLQYQEECLKKLYGLLVKNDPLSEKIKLEMEAQAMRVLGTKTVPSAESQSVLPFLVFDDEGGWQITFLYDAPPNTFWSSFLRNAFGSDFLQLQRKIYALSRTRASSKNILTANNYIFTRTDVLEGMVEEGSSFGGDDTFDHVLQEQGHKLALSVGSNENRRGSNSDGKKSLSNLPRGVSPEFGIGLKRNDGREILDDEFGEFLRSPPIQKKMSFGSTSSRPTPNLEQLKKMAKKRKPADSEMTEKNKQKFRRSLPLFLSEDVTSTPISKRREHAARAQNQDKHEKVVASNPGEETSDPILPVSSNEIISSLTKCPIQGCTHATKYKHNIRKHLMARHKVTDTSPYTHVWLNLRNPVGEPATAASASASDVSGPSTPVKSGRTNNHPLESDTSNKSERKRVSITVEMDSSSVVASESILRRSRRVKKNTPAD